MVHRLALAVAAGAAALTLTVALAAAGFAPGRPATPTDLAAADVAAADIAPAADGASADSAPTVQVDTIYLAPPPKQETVTIHKVVKTAGGEHESENESGNGD